MAKKPKKNKEPNGWTLYSGLYEINWKKGVAIEVAIEGIIFKSTGKEIPSNTVVRNGLKK